jgi:hypothetical protein
MKRDITIVTPLYNDWTCLSILISDIEKTIGHIFRTINIIAVNDCSVEEKPSSFPTGNNVNLEIVDLVTNVGHQRAILIGLCYCFEKKIDSDYFIVMDSDGEDNPKYIDDLVKMSDSSSIDKVIFAKRSKRSEAWSFRFFYRIYKFVFKLMTGASISFGNFSCIPKSILHRVCNEPNF